MITIEEKLNIFSKLVLEGERKKARENIDKIQEDIDKKVKEHLDKSKKRAEEQVQKRINEANNRKKEIIAKANKEAKSKILAKKREFLSRLQDALENRAIKFIETDEYETFFFDSLSKLLLQIKEKENNSIYITNNDSNRFSDKIMNKLDNLMSQGIKVTLENMDDREIGGLMLINHDRGVRFDLTIKTILEANKDLVGRMIYLSLEEVGD